MKEKLQNIFKETPERFSYTIESVLDEVRFAKKRKRNSSAFRVVIAMVLILAIIPSAVFGAVKICGAIAQRVGNFGLSVNIAINEDVPKYVKMNIDVPKGFKEQENSDGLKFDRDTEEWQFGFTIIPMRFYESVDYTVLEKDVKEYNKVSIASRPSYELISTDDYNGFKRYFVWFEEANVLMLIYRGETVTDSELATFVDSISFTEGTKSDHDRFFEPEKESPESEDNTATYYEYEHDFIELDRATEITFAGFSEETSEENLEVKSTITDIRITDNIDGLDTSGINSLYQSEKIADKNGKLIPRVVEIWQEGDGVNTETKMLSCESMEQKLVLVDIEYTNTSDTEVNLYIPHRMEILKKDESGYYISGNIVDQAQNIAVNEYFDTEIFYMSDHGETDKEFYCPKLLPNETRTITLGFRCIDEQLKNAYLYLNPATDGVIAPDYTAYLDNPYTYFIFKVQ